MHSEVPGAVLWVPVTEDEKEEVRQQMNRLLDTHHFKNSRRYPALLRFIVEETLEGRGEYLKERLLGIRVFDRLADYDTAADPIVRVTVAEIRKRIAQYYHEEAHEAEMRIEMTPGRYVPEFHPRRETDSSWPLATSVSEGAPKNPSANTKTVQPVVGVVAAPASSGLLSRRLRIALSAASILLVGLASFLGWRWTHPTAIEQFWRPILAAGTPVTFCLPIPDRAKLAVINSSSFGTAASAKTADLASNSASTFLYHESLGENVVFSDVLAAVRISDLLAAHNRGSKLRISEATTLSDLREGPTVLIGGLDNPWTMRVIAPLRYHFAGTGDEKYWIEDAKDPGNRMRALDLKTKYGAVLHDFALVARIHDESTGQVEVVAAGIGMSGTAAAGEFLTDPHQLDLLRSKVGAGFKEHDFEVVLGTDVVNGTAGPPKILAVAVW